MQPVKLCFRLLRHGIECALLVAMIANFSGAVNAQSPEETVEPPLRWWKGNLHTHSLWSDGDQFPEMIADWYQKKGYNFLALTDHNVLSEGARWMAMSKIVKRSDDEILERYRSRFGKSWVETRGTEGTPEFEVRLKPLNEFRSLIEQRGEFLMIPAEEISDKAAGKPVHINATNIAEVIPPAGGSSVREAMQNNLRSILHHEEQHGLEVLPHLNHPNFHYAVTAEDLAAVTHERFFEVYNGHPGVNHLGDADHPGVEAIWDQINAIRLTDVNVPPIMGIATDDSHEYHGRKGARPGRGWIMVRSRYLTPERLIRAMKAGDFYASSGVTLSDLSFNEDTRELKLSIVPEENVTYRTEFIATLAGDAKDTSRIGKVVAESNGLNAVYQQTDRELYIRAVVHSTKKHPDPSFENQVEQAWTQPVGWGVSEQLGF